ncbi:hypothetical protein RB620_10545 [Paenibacillus sp. LHD-117]|uniref:hypothetical protein n=1 Tax=Paenibacillus sp. LHD-117 TaxID=3071412 RepID=UPI0027E0DCBA|nr:hypothetical protein [Paenibacillus sp. LHD-117]MDQ6419871.1 hypothetical protein [Paenibacillus sp. LHD-117]
MLCPLCNGIGDYLESCKSCGGKVTECGRLSDWTGPYEPYGPIEGSLQNNMPISSAGDVCCHVIYCENCSRVSEILISEWPS